METTLENIYYFSLITSIVVGFMYFFHNKKITFLHFLPFFILMIFGVERYGIYLSDNGHQNAWLFNYSSTAEVCFYSWLISKVYIQKKAYRVAFFLNMIVLIASIINIVFFQGKKGFHTITYGIGSINVIVCSIYYFYQIFVFPSQAVLYKQMEFWVVTAILFYFTCGFPIFVLNNIYFHKVSEEIWPIIGAINDCINISFYSLFTIAFLCKIKKY